MSKLRKAVRPTSFFLSPVAIVLVVLLLHAMLLGMFFYLGAENHLSIEPAEIALLVTYTGITFVIAIVIGLQRHRWIKREGRVRQRLLDVIDAIPDPSAVRDVKGRYIMWNKAAESYYGIKAEHVLGKTPFELFPKDVARQLLELDAESSLTNQTVVRRVVIPPIYGKGQRVTSIRVAPVQSASDNSSGSVRGVVTILHDVTDEEKEATKLRHLSTQLKMALDTSGFGSWIWDLENNLVTYSPQYQAMLRYKGNFFSAEFDFFARIHPGDAQTAIDAGKRSIKENIPYDQVYRLRCFDEVYRYFHASGEPALDDRGRRYFAGLLCPLDRSGT